MNQIIFSISTISILAIILLSIYSMTSEEFEFFPPPGNHTWQYRIFWLLFRAMFLGLIFLSISDFSSLQFIDTIFRFALGLPVLVLGFSAALYLSVFLGWKNAHGEQQGLITSGWFRWSRNPIYVASIIGMLGWGLFVDSLFVYILLALWALLYLLAPFAEEPWLAEKYGAKYADYKSRVPRFVGLPSSKT